MSITDTDFVSAFEDQSLDPALFDHIGHLRIAWLYLKRHDLDEAIRKVTTGIASYATSLGATDKFQHTLTEAIVRLMAYRIHSTNDSDFSDFLLNNRDLVENLPNVLNTYYSAEVLNSDIAKTSYLEPDKKPFELNQ